MVAGTSAEHTSRLKVREISLEDCFSIPRMEKAWQKFVYAGLRSQEFLDLHDYYDFHKNRKIRIREIRGLVTSGRYKPKPPLFVRLEKSKGLCRLVAIPSPEDALVLQTLVETISPELLSAQPSKNAFYSRSHARGHTKISVDKLEEYFWFHNWIEFSKRVFEFSYAYPYLIMTDLANYYDNISLSALRNMLSSYGKFHEEIMDFLFYVLEAFAWGPDYLPMSGRGLPQLNFDAPRLLAHAFLYEADKLIHERNDGAFVRWMDDIDIPIESLEKGKLLLRDLDDLLMGRGIRLNSGKTRILSGRDARTYLLPDENRYLSIFQRRVERLRGTGQPLLDEKRRLRKRFRKFLQKPKIGRWEKVYKRYFSIFGNLGDPYLEQFVPELLNQTPDLRQSIYKYYLALGPSKKRLRHFAEYVLGENCLDDSSVFQIARVIVSWPVGKHTKFRKEITKFARYVGHKQELRPIAGVAAALWLLGKYGTNSELEKYIIGTEETWRSSEYLSRQVSSLYPRLRRIKRLPLLVSRVLSQSGQTSALNVLLNFRSLRDQTKIGKAEKLYLKNRTPTHLPYPIQKFFIAWTMIESKTIARKDRAEIRAHLIGHVADPIYVSILQSIRV